MSRVAASLSDCLWRAQGAAATAFPDRKRIDSRETEQRWRERMVRSLVAILVVVVVVAVMLVVAVVIFTLT